MKRDVIKKKDKIGVIVPGTCTSSPYPTSTPRNLDFSNLKFCKPSLDWVSPIVVFPRFTVGLTDGSLSTKEEGSAGGKTPKRLTDPFGTEDTTEGRNGK